MDLTKLRPEFSVLAIDGNPLDARVVADNLKAAGYEDRRFFPSPSLALPSIRETPPHIVLLDYQGFWREGEAFLANLKAISEEILVILVCTQAKFQDAQQLVARGLAFDVIARPFSSPLDLIERVDRGCLKLYHQFESEQLAEQQGGEPAVVPAPGPAPVEAEHEHAERTVTISTFALPDEAPESATTGAASAEDDDKTNVIVTADAADTTSVTRTINLADSMNRTSPVDSAGANASEVAAGDGGATADWSVLAEALARFAATAEVDQSVQVFMEALSRLQGNVPVLYFRYVPSHMSLLFSQAVLVPFEKFRGIGLNLKNTEAARLSDLFREPAHLPGLSELIEKVFRSPEFIAFGHWDETDFIGLFVVLGRADLAGLAGPSSRSSSVAANEILGAEAPMPVLALQVAFELAYQRAVVLKENHALDTTDHVSGLSNRRHFMRLLDDEISRSRRIMMPVTLITLELDEAPLLHQKLGGQQVDSLLKMVGAILRKTTRTNDILARTAAHEFSILLPHTSHQGGAVKAERFRRMIEATKFPLLESQGLDALTVSCGVSEYPSFSSDAEGLIQSSHEAIEQVKAMGGNRACLAAAPEGFQMDFAPHDVPSWRGVSRVSGRDPGHGGDR